MAKQIWKYPLKVVDVQQIKIKGWAEVLCVQTQNNTPCLWAEVDTEEEDVTVTVEIFGTGHNVPENANRSYIGTFQMDGGSLVFHCFIHHRLTE